jgi:hypothetical protein
MVKDYLFEEDGRSGYSDEDEEDGDVDDESFGADNVVSVDVPNENHKQQQGYNEALEQGNPDMESAPVKMEQAEDKSDFRCQSHLRKQ